MSLSNIYIIIYIALWFITSIIYWRKKKQFGVGNLLLASYFLYAVLSFFLYNNEWTGSEFGDLKLFPFIYLFVLMLIASLPVLKYEERSLIQRPTLSLINLLVYIYVVSTLLVLPYILVDVKDGIILILTTDTGGDELYQEYRNYGVVEREWSLYNIFKIFFNFFRDFGVLLFFYYATLKEKKDWLLITMGIAIIVSMLESLAHGLRTSITMKLLAVLFTYFLFRTKLPRQVNKIMKIIGGYLLGFVLLYIIIVNYSRYSEGSYGNYQLLNYSGQANLYFNKYALDAGGIRYGDRTFAMFKSWLPFDNVPRDFLECREKYPNMRFDDSRFSTFIGDFALDFGPVGAAILIIFFSLIFLRLTKGRKNTILFHQLILIFFVMEVCVQGAFYLFNFSFDNNIRIVYLFLFYLLFKWDYDTVGSKNFSNSY